MDLLISYYTYSLLEMLLKNQINFIEGRMTMIKGIGVDIIELKRIEHAIEKNKRFYDRILTEREKEMVKQFTTLHRKVEFTAGRFAAKEAYAKANGTGIGGALSFVDIEILPDENGKPEVYLKGKKCKTAFLSISHSTQFVVAQVVIEES